MKQEGGSAGLLREGKGSTWEGGMREPCIFWGPGRIQPGLVKQIGTTMDLFTTFSKLANVPLPDDRQMDGKDLGPTLFEKKPSERKEVFYYRGDELYAVRLGAFKAHFITEGAYGPPMREEHDPPILYNLEVDPSEKYNVAENNPEIIEQIKALVKEHNSNLVKGEDQLKDRG